tara:strand:- start:687 stop:1181 length:495 start_codon:yes stop_codon:yes gene_type:complete
MKKYNQLHLLIDTLDCENMDKRKQFTKHEQMVFDAVAEKFRREVFPAKDPYSRFDGEDEDYIYEIKYRDNHYQKTLIEFDKFAFNHMYSYVTSREFIYCVGYDMEDYIKVFIFNVSRLCVHEYQFGWEWREMPLNSIFGNSEKINKFVGYIDCKEAIKSITIKT